MIAELTNGTRADAIVARSGITARRRNHRAPRTEIPLTLPRRGRSNRLAPMLQHTKRATRVAVGAVLVLIGIVLAVPFVPGPGLLLIFVGLGVVGREFEWARGLRERMHQQFRRV